MTRRSPFRLQPSTVRLLLIKIYHTFAPNQARQM